MPSVTLEQALQIAIQQHRAGNLTEAESIYRQILQQHPDHPIAMNNLASVLRMAGRLDEAIVVAQCGLQLLPNAAEPYSNLGVLLHRRERRDEALPLLERAATLAPNSADTQFDYANILLDFQRLPEAEAAYRRTIALNPAHAEAYSNLGTLLHMTGRLEESLACDRRAFELKPSYWQAHSRMLYTMNFLPGYDPQGILREHVRFGEIHAAPLAREIRPHANDRSPDRRLKIGYVSPDFKQHAVAIFLKPLLASRDRANFHVTCYSDVVRPDRVTEEIKSLADWWRDVSGLSDAQLAEQVRADGIDILVDLALHTDGNRMLTFARKPAPLQVSYLGYPGTTGVPAIDYRLTDPHLDPPDAPQPYVEKSLYLPRTYWCYSAPTEAPEPVAERAGPITFGCLNTFAKISSECLQTWARILDQVADSRMIIYAAEGSHRERVRATLGDRVDFVPRQSTREYLGTYNRIDIALDPFPYAGGTTTCDALWMSVPVVTLAGRIAVHRSGVSLLTNVGLPDLIARTPDEYVKLATNLAKDRERLAKLRKSIRSMLQQSPVRDAESFARDVEEAFRKIWKGWCAGSSVI